MIYEPNSSYSELFQDVENDAFQAGIRLSGVRSSPYVALDNIAL